MQNEIQIDLTIIGELDKFLYVALIPLDKSRELVKYSSLKQFSIYCNLRRNLYNLYT